VSYFRESLPIFQGLAMTDFVTVARVGEIPEGEGRSFVVGESVVAVFLVDGKYYAINDLCPHQGASLSCGEVVDHVVTCPWHAWRFRVDDGTWCDNRRIKTDSYEVRVAGEEIQVRVPAEETS
jgi:nitrite reductase (NADH) small subunit/3-phenylpropionate/trans-cinnamate dioxygenase ferredoxin subunit